MAGRAAHPCKLPAARAAHQPQAAHRPPAAAAAGHARIDTSVSWAPVVKRRQFPRPGARVKWAASDQGLLHAFPPPLLWNFG